MKNLTTILNQLTQNRNAALWLLLWMSLSPLLISPVFSYGAIHYETILSTFSVNIWIIISLISGVAIGLAVLPSSLVALLAGYFLGFAALPGVAVAYTIASLVGFQLARWMDHGAFNRTIAHLPTKQALLARQIQEGVVTNQLGITTLSRLSPIMPFTMMNVVLPLAGVSMRNYLLGGFLGTLPRILLLVWLGSEAQEVYALIKHDGDMTTQLLFAGMLLLSIAGTSYYAKRIFHQQLAKVPVRV
ncbi:MAG: TVP38/TMEM64 family protein [Cyclobacteriaceae bacterium]